MVPFLSLGVGHITKNERSRYVRQINTQTFLDEKVNWTELKSMPLFSSTTKHTKSLMVEFPTLLFYTVRWCQGRQTNKQRFSFTERKEKHTLKAKTKNLILDNNLNFSEIHFTKTKMGCPQKSWFFFIWVNFVQWLANSKMFKIVYFSMVLWKLFIWVFLISFDWWDNLVFSFNQNLGFFLIAKRLSFLKRG
jgi:hypothetical protein